MQGSKRADVGEPASGIYAGWPTWMAGSGLDYVRCSHNSHMQPGQPLFQYQNSQVMRCFYLRNPHVHNPFQLAYAVSSSFGHVSDLWICCGHLVQAGTY